MFYIGTANCFILALQLSPLLSGCADHFVLVLQTRNSIVKFNVLAFALVEICNAFVE